MAQVNIKPISDLNQYNDVLKDVQIGSPVFLTKNGNGKYVIYDINDPVLENFYISKADVTDSLIAELREIENKADKEGWLTLDDVKSSLKKTFPWLNK